MKPIPDQAAECRRRAAILEEIARAYPPDQSAAADMARRRAGELRREAAQIEEASR